MSDYKKEMNLGDSKTTDLFLEQIRILIREEFNKLYKRYDLLPAKVINVGSGVATITFDGTNNIPNVKNKSGEVLNINDEVYIQVIGNLNNIFIAYKK